MPERLLSCFLCREMIYEHLMNLLDSRRQKAVVDHLASCTECSAIAEKQRTALSYLEALGKTKISTKTVQDIKTKSSWISLRSRWKRLPESIKWGTEALFVALIVAASFHFGSEWISKTKVEATKDVVLAEVDTTQPLPGEAGSTNLPEDKLADSEPEEATETDMHGGSELGDGPDVPATEEATDAATENNDAEPAPTDTPVFLVKTPPGYKAPKTPLVLAPSTPPPTIVPVAVATTAPTTTAASKVSSVTVPQAEGFVYRMAMSLADVDGTVPSIAERIRELGGLKAGQVELGWKKPGGSYFHFTMPEEKHETLMKYLRSFAQVRGSKDPHKRVMPPGTIRIILWVEELNPPPSSEPDQEDQATEAAEENGGNAEPSVAPVAPNPEENE